MVYRILLLMATIQLAISASTGETAKPDDGFTTDIFSNILQEDEHQGKNIIISPVSVQTALAMAFFGAGDKTAEEMVTGLHLKSSDKTKVSEHFQNVLDSVRKSSNLNIANKMYVNQIYEIHPEFNEAAVKAFHSEAEKLDFSKKEESVKTINDWVESKTNNKIKDLVLPSMIGPDSSMLLVNAIYFKADWATKFYDPSKKDFWLNENDKKSVDTMVKTFFIKHADLKDLDATAVELPYADGDYAMMLILPKKRDGLKALESKIKSVDFLEIGRKMERKSVYVQMPLFKANFDLSLKSTLKKMGMESMFTENANFQHIFKTKTPYQISDVIHKAYISVDENGSEAAAATVILPVGQSGISGPRPIDFIADHPFIFMILDKDRIYFIGHIKEL